MFINPSGIALTRRLQRSIVGKAEVHFVSQCERIQHSLMRRHLNAGRHRRILISEANADLCRRVTQSNPPRKPKVTRASLRDSRTLLTECSLFRIAESKSILMPRNSGSRCLRSLPLRAALPTPGKFRTPFLPPCQSVPNKSAAYLRSAKPRDRSGRHRSMGCLWSHGYCSGTFAHPDSETSGMAQR